MLMRGVGQELHVDAGVVRGTADGALPPLHALAVNTRRVMSELQWSIQVLRLPGSSHGSRCCTAAGTWQQSAVMRWRGFA